MKINFLKTFFVLMGTTSVVWAAPSQDFPVYPIVDNLSADEALLVQNAPHDNMDTGNILAKINGQNVALDDWEVLVHSTYTDLNALSHLSGFHLLPYPETQVMVGDLAYLIRENNPGVLNVENYNVESLSWEYLHRRMKQIDTQGVLHEQTVLDFIPTAGSDSEIFSQVVFNYNTNKVPLYTAEVIDFIKDAREQELPWSSANSNPFVTRYEEHLNSPSILDDMNDEEYHDYNPPADEVGIIPSSHSSDDENLFD